MSAQIAAALRRRAAALKEEAHTLQLGGEVPPGPQGRPRPPEFLLLIADEFRALADEAEAAKPETGLDRVAEAVRRSRGGRAPVQPQGFA